MKSKNLQGFSIVYVIFISSIVILLWIIVVNKQSYLSAMQEYSNIEYSMLKRITAKSLSTLQLFQTEWESLKYEMLWYIENNSSFYNIFWNHPEIVDFMSSNVNISPQYKYLSWVTSWYVQLDVNEPFVLKVVEIEKNYLQINKKILPIEEYEIMSPTQILWYIKSDNTIQTSTWNYKIYDFQNKNYAFFLRSWSWVVQDYSRYSVKIFDQNGSWIYINPIHDGTNPVSYKWYDVKKIGTNYIFKILDF